MRNLENQVNDEENLKPLFTERIIDPLMSQIALDSNQSLLIILEKIVSRLETKSRVVILIKTIASIELCSK